MDDKVIKKLTEFLSNLPKRRYSLDEEPPMEGPIEEHPEEQQLVMMLALVCKEKGALDAVSSLVRIVSEYNGAAPMLQDFIRYIEDNDEGAPSKSTADDEVSRLVLVAPFDRVKIKEHLKEFKAELLKQIEAHGGITAVAKKANLSQPSLSRMLNAEDMVPQTGTLEALFRAMGIQGLGLLVK